MKTINHKKATIILVCLILSITKIYGQAGVDWQLVGNALGGGEKLGATTAFPVDFYSSNTRFMRLDAAGLFGIGTNYNPSFRLDVWDDINIAPQAANFIDDGYRIGSNLVLYIPGTNNTFVGRSGNLIIV